MPSSIPADLAATRIINAAGTLTRLSGARVSDAVAAAMAEAAAASFDMWRLQAAASARIASATGAEAGLVTTGAAAGLTLAAAAAIAGCDPASMQRLPRTEGMSNEIVVPRTHRNGYDRALAAAGAVVVDVGMADRETDAGIRGLEAWEVEAAIGPRTVALSCNASAATEIDLDVLAEVAGRRGLPLIVDAAAQVPPVANLRAHIAKGATLVVFSGGKAIGGPQGTGILAGRRDLVASAALQMLDMDVDPGSFEPPAAFFGNARPPALPRHGIGRGFKASKEAIVGLMVALDAFIGMDEAATNAAVRSRLVEIGRALGEHPGLTARVVDGRRDGAPPRLTIQVDASTAGIGAAGLSRSLRNGTPSIHVSEARVRSGVLLLDLAAVRPLDDATLLAGIARALAVRSGTRADAADAHER